MSSAREQILGGIRKSLGRGKLEGEAAAALDQRLARHERILVPKRSEGDQAHKVRVLDSARRSNSSASVSSVSNSATVGAFMTSSFKH